MLLYSICAFIGLLGVCGDEKQKKDMKQFDGTWLVESVTWDGKPIEMWPKGKKAFKFDDSRFTSFVDLGGPQGNRIKIHRDYSLTP
jgi:hypothetical protein